MPLVAVRGPNNSHNTKPTTGRKRISSVTIAARLIIISSSSIPGPYPNKTHFTRQGHRPAATRINAVACLSMLPTTP